MQLYVTYCLSRNTRPKFWCCWIREVWKIRRGRIIPPTGNTELLNGDVYRCAWLNGRDCSFLQKRDWENETGRYEGRTMKINGKNGGELRHSKTRIKTVFFNITKRNINWSYLKAR